MKSRYQGFTLIELVVVIVILGILAATALPKFIDLSTEARTAATQGVASAISAASALNFGARKVTSTKGSLLNQANVCTTALLDPIMQGGVPAGYTIGSTGDCGAAGDGETVTCSVADATVPAISKTATIICSN